MTSVCIGPAKSEDLICNLLKTRYAACEWYGALVRTEAGGSFNNGPKPESILQSFSPCCFISYRAGVDRREAGKCSLTD